MDVLEEITTRHHDGYFVDLFVRASNKSAIQMYTKVKGFCLYLTRVIFSHAADNIGHVST